jgi:hypothetical protein
VVLSIRPRNKTKEHAVENTKFTLAKKKHACLARSSKTMPVCFFAYKGIVYHKFIVQGQKVNQQCYLEVLTRLRESVRRKQHELWPDKWILHRDNAPAHDALRVPEFLAKKSITKMVVIFGSSKIKRCPEGTKIC